MRRQTKSKLKTYALGTLTGAILIYGINLHLSKINNGKEETINDEFSRPKLEESFKDTKTVEQYKFDFYDGEITIQDEDLEIYTFDKLGNVIEIEPEKAEIPVEDNKYLLDEYISEREALVYEYVENKDKIKDQFTIYLLFQELEELYKEYLTRKPFDTLENRKEVIYSIGYNYILSNEGYTIGGYKFSELEKAIQKDILEFYQSINYMRKNNMVKEESTISKFIDRQEKAFNYIVLQKGRK